MSLQVTPVEIPISSFDCINKKFKNVTEGEILQSMEFQRDVVERVEVTAAGRFVLTEIIEKIEEKLLHLSYTHRLYDMCLAWESKPLAMHVPNFDMEDRFVCVAKLTIYKETPRVKN